MDAGDDSSEVENNNAFQEQMVRRRNGDPDCVSLRGAG